MKKNGIFALLVLIPLYIFSAPERSSDIYGVWKDYRSEILLKIKPTKRRGILVKRLDSRHLSQWVRYDRVGYRHYDDCEGNTLKLTGYGLKWRKSYGRRTFIMEKTDDGYDRWVDAENYDDYSYLPKRRRHRYLNSISGSWYCAAHDVNIDIEYYKGGIKVRRYNYNRDQYDKWYTYRKGRNTSNRYYGENERFYELYEDRLVFYDKHLNRRLEFEKRQ
ncbi:MAG: hypothetical protein V3V00_14970 [Saprospiraceae bacterium]